MVVAYPGVRFREGRSFPNLAENLLNLSGNTVVLWTIRAGEFASSDVGSLKPLSLKNQRSRGALIDQLVRALASLVDKTTLVNIAQYIPV